MIGHIGPWHRVPRCSLPSVNGLAPGGLLLIAAIVATAVGAAAQDTRSSGARPEISASALGDSVCAEILAAFESLEPEALRVFFSGGQVQLGLGEAGSGGRAVEGSFSAEQAVVLLRGALATDAPRVLASTAPGDLVSPAEGIACNCPGVTSGETSAILVLHFGVVSGDEFGRRLYLDLRRQSPTSGAQTLSLGPWKIRAVRDIR